MLRIRIRYQRKRKCSFRDHFTQAKKEKTTVIYAKNSKKVPKATSAMEGAVFESILPQQKKGDDENTRLEFRESTSANESAV